MSRATLNAWIQHWKAKGYWCSCCLSCGAWYAQKHRGLAGRRSIICKLQRCLQWRTYQLRNGRAPPAWLVLKWAALADKPRTSNTKAHDEPRFRGAA